MMFLWIEVDGKNPEVQLSHSYKEPEDKAIIIHLFNPAIRIVKYETIANLD